MKSKSNPASLHLWKKVLLTGVIQLTWGDCWWGGGRTGYEVDTGSYCITYGVLAIHWLTGSTSVVQHKAWYNINPALGSEETVSDKQPFYKSIVILNFKYVNKSSAENDYR